MVVHIIKSISYVTLVDGVALLSYELNFSVLMGREAMWRQ